MYGKTVSVVFQKRDWYKRIVGTVLVDGADAGLNHVQSGLAWHYKGYEREQYPEDRAAYACAEDKALGRARGVWRDRAPCHHGTSVGTERCAAASPSRARGSIDSRRPSIPPFPKSTPATLSVANHPGHPRIRRGGPRTGRDALGLVSYWSKEPKILYSTFNARAETRESASKYGRHDV